MRVPRLVPLLGLWTIGAVSALGQEVLLPNVHYAPSEVLPLWPGEPPGEPGGIGPEHILESRPRTFDQIADVTAPTVAVFLPEPAERTGTGVLVVPGGGLERLAIEHEGFEVAEWLNQHGIAAFLLKYRVPPRNPERRFEAGLQDAQRAMGLIRSRAGDWGVEADSVGAIGFSAGGEIDVLLSIYDERQYEPVDAADRLPSRPSFNVAIYPGGLVGRDGTLRADVESRIGSGTPPMFVVHAFDDSARNSILLMDALKRGNVASELHIFAAGGHGFGFREAGPPLDGWRGLLVGWLEWLGYLDDPEVRTYARDLEAAWESGAATLPRFGSDDLDRAFAAQRRIVGSALSRGAEVVGYVGSADGAAHGALLDGGRLEAGPGAEPAIHPARPARIGVGIGFTLATDLGTKIRVPRQAITAIESVVPVIELPADLDRLMGGPVGVTDRTAANLGASRFVTGPALQPAALPDLADLDVTLFRDGEQIQRSSSSARGGAGPALMALVNQVVEQSRVIRRGQLLVLRLGAAPEAEPGRYVARFGELGVIELTLR